MVGRTGTLGIHRPGRSQLLCDSLFPQQALSPPSSTGSQTFSLPSSPALLLLLIFSRRHTHLLLHRDQKLRNTFKLLSPILYVFLKLHSPPSPSWYKFSPVPFFLSVVQITPCPAHPGPPNSTDYPVFSVCSPFHWLLPNSTST